jgi:hypothetical protein
MLFLAVPFCATVLALGESAPQNANRIRPPKIMLRAAAGSEHGILLAIEVSNPNDAALVYTGYAANSFDPPLPPGRISPICQIELKRDSQWRPHPIGYCGFGLTDQELAPGATAAFDVLIPNDNWQAVKVAFGGVCGFSDGEATTATLWSAEFTREAIEARRGEQAPSAGGLPQGKWQVDFANGVIESCEFRADHSVAVAEPQRTSAGRMEIDNGNVIIVFDDDRLERWTAVGKSYVVEHWFPSSRLPKAAPVVGIAERTP